MKFTQKTIQYVRMKKSLRYFLLLALFGLSLTPTAEAKKKQQQAKAINAELTQQDKNKFNYYFCDAIRCMQQQNFSSAIDLLTECYYINSKSAAVANEFAKIYSLMQDTQHAQKFSELASQLDPSNDWYQISLAELYVKNGDYDKAINVYEQIAARRPDNEDYVYMLASLYKQQGKYKESINALNRMEKITGIDERISFEKYRLYYTLNDQKNADEEIDKLIKKYPLNANYHVLRGKIYIDEKKEEKGLQEYELARKIEPNNHTLLTSEMSYYKDKDDSEKADSIFLNALNNPSLSADEKVELITNILREKDISIAKMEKYFTTLNNQYPDNEIILSYYVSFMLMQRRYDEAEPLLNKMLKLNPANKEGWGELINLYAVKNNPQKMESACDSASSHMPNEALFPLMKGVAFLMEDKKKEAIESTKKSTRLASAANDSILLSNAWMQVGDIFSANNAIDSSLVYYEKSYQVNSNSALLLNNYAYNLAIKGEDLMRAEEMSAKALSSDPNNVSYLDTYAWIFFLENRITMAKMYIQQAYDKGGSTNETVVEHFGDISAKDGNIDEAVKYWQKALDMKSTSPTLQRKIDARQYIAQ